MNQTLQDIYSRRSIRSYLSNQIKDDELENIIKAGLYAPSAINQQSWHFTVIQKKALIDDINNQIKAVLMASDIQRLQEMVKREGFHAFYHAPTIIIVSGKKDNLYPEIDCAMAAENMLLAAESLNIGSCLVAMSNHLFNSEKSDEYKEKLEIPKDYQPYFSVILGYRKNKVLEPPERLEGRVNYIK